MRVDLELLNLFFPQRCVLCNAQSSGFICQRCLEKLEPYAGNRCRVCSKPLAYKSGDLLCASCLAGKRHFEYGFSLFSYKEGAIKRLIEIAKFNSLPRVLSFIERYLDELPDRLLEDLDCVVPVPMHKNDIRKRGYNQCAYIARYLARRFSLKICWDLLIKTKQTQHQVGLDLKRRKTNLKDAFECRPKRNIRRVLIVDDVFTTGSTINECARVLSRAKIASVFFTVATTPAF